MQRSISLALTTSAAPASSWKARGKILLADTERDTSICHDHRARAPTEPAG
jgi:hypothetical protein